MGTDLRVYFDSDASLDPMAGKTLGIIGYGNQGRAQALNLKDNGITAVIGGRGGATAEVARNDGFPVVSIAEAAEQSDFLFLLIPDEAAPDVYTREIEPHLSKGNLLNFASGYNITYGKIVPPDFVDVVMVAPRMIGEKLRERFTQDEGTPAFISVQQDASGEAQARALAIGLGIGVAKGGMLEVSFDDETFLDLFMEQGVWAAIMQILSDSFEVLVEEGFPPEILALEFFASAEMAEIARAMAEVGCFKQMSYHSHTSQYGTLTRGRQVIPGSVRWTLQKILNDGIRSGEFAKEWSREQANGLPRFQQLKAATEEHAITQGEDRLRKLLRKET